MSLFNNTGLPLRSTLPTLDDPLDNLSCLSDWYWEINFVKSFWFWRSATVFWSFVFWFLNSPLRVWIIFWTFCPSAVNTSFPDMLTPSIPDNSLVEAPVFFLRVSNCLLICFCHSFPVKDVSPLISENFS